MFRRIIERLGNEMSLCDYSCLTYVETLFAVATRAPCSAEDIHFGISLIMALSQVGIMRQKNNCIAVNSVPKFHLNNLVLV